jgi:hypothetical protein
VPSYDLSRAVWRTSSYSGTNGACVEVAVVPSWQVSTYSGQNGARVEVAGNLPEIIAVRDSKDQDGPVLAIGPAEWRNFTDLVKAGQFDPR